MITRVEAEYDNVVLGAGLYDAPGLMRVSPFQTIAVHRNYQSGPGLGVSYPVGCSPAVTAYVGTPPSPPQGQSMTARVRIDFPTRTVTFTALGTTWSWTDPSLPTAKVISTAAGTKIDLLVGGCGPGAVVAPTGSRVKLTVLEGTNSPGTVPALSGCAFGPTANGTAEFLAGSVAGNGSDAAASVTGNCAVRLLEFDVNNVALTGALYDTPGLVRFNGVTLLGMHRNYQTDNSSLWVTYPAGCTGGRTRR